jgi:Leucine-rich repeat (LRR) protein
MANKSNGSDAGYAEALRRIEICRKAGSLPLDIDELIENLNAEKEAEVGEQNFERAAGLRDQADKLKKLAELGRRDLRDPTLPPEIGKLAALRWLDLRESQLTTLPPEIGQLTALTTLILSGNQLTTLPPEIGQLTALTTLYLSGNQLTTMPPEIGRLTALTSLYLSGNQLTTMPPEIVQLTGLTTLYLSGNQLTTMPPEIGQLTGLTSLYLSGNQLTTMPPEIVQLTGLTSLDLSGNQLTTLPPEIGQLTGLTSLDLSGNQLTTLPPQIGNLTALTWLNLEKSQLTTLPPEIGQLTALTSLILGGNQFMTLPPEIGQLTALTWLDLRESQLTTLPPQIGNLTALTWLNLQESQLTTLPPQIGQLTALTSLDLRGNPLPAELLKLDSKGLIRYFRELAATTTPKRFDEAKLLVVGPGEVGKTWLLAALQGRTPQKTPSTKGLEIAREPLPLPHPTEPGRTLQLNCWDFGGQDLYQITHQIFFSNKAIYLLVWKPRAGVDPDLIARLDRIQLSAGRTAKVLMVSTHADENVPAAIGKDALRQRFGDLIWDFCEADSAKGAEGTGIANLRVEIARAAAQLEGMDTPFPPGWHTAQAAIRKSKKTTITFAEFAKTCKSKGGIDILSSADLATVMEVQGHAVFFADAAGKSASGLADEKNLVVLDPEWLAKAVGFVLEDKATMARSGILEHDRLAAIWKKDAKRDCPGYRRDLHGYLLWLMWKFDIAYRQNENTSLLPELIQRNRPDDLRWTPALPASSEREASLICRIPQHPPLGLIPALTAAVHPLRRVQNPEPNQDQLDHNWRDGFFLDTLMRGTAFVELQDRDLLIVVRDKIPSDLSRRVTRTLDEIVKVRWPRLRIDLRVPCIGKLDGKACSGTFRKDVLETRSTVFCEDCRQDLDAKKMLEGFDAHEDAMMRKLHELKLELLAGQQEFLAASFRFFRQALDPARQELERAPCMFTILPEGAKSWQLLAKMSEDRLRITCWCEHPDGPHPGAPTGSSEPPDYILKMPKGWVVNAAPYISWAATLLKAFVPMAGTATQQLVEGAGPALAFGDLKNQIGLMNDAVKALPAGKLEPGRWDDLPGISQWARPEIVALRHIHDALLAQVTEAKRWGDLRPVRTKSGELLWLCGQHAAIQQPPVQQL